MELRRYLLVLLVVGIAGGSVTPGTVARRVDVAAGVIAFESDRTGTTNVYLADAAGGGLRQVTTGGGHEPTWSPDGTKLAFNRNGDLFVARADGTGVRRIRAGVDQAWSPDGTKLAFVSGWDIGIANTDGTGVVRLTSDADPEDINTLSALPSWSPDGTRIAFERFSGLFVVNTDGTGLRRLSAWGNDPGYSARPQWSPDGRSIAYIGSCKNCASGGVDSFMLGFGGYEDKLRVLRVPGGAQRTVAETPGDVFAWSPDGTQLAYSRPVSGADDAPTAIYLAPAGGGASTRITSSAAGENASAPAWSPDGGRLAFERERVPARLGWEGSDIAVIRADGTGELRLTQPFPTGGANYAPAWGPGVLHAQVATPPSPSVTIPGVVRTENAIVWELAAAGSRAAFLWSGADAPAFWDPSPGRLRQAGSEYDGGYWVTATTGYAAWFAAFAHGVSEPVTDVSLMLTSVETKRSVELDWVERQGHNPPYETGPRLAGDESLIAYNPDSRGSKLYRIDTEGAKPALKLISTDVAVAAVGQGRIAGWRGANSLVVLRSDGHVLGTAPFARAHTTSVALDGQRLFTTSGSRLSLSGLGGGVRRTWPLVDEGGGTPTLAGIRGDLAVYVSGTAVHLLRLSSGRDVVLHLANPGGWTGARLTSSGLFTTTNSPHTQRPARLGYYALADLLARTA